MKGLFAASLILFAALSPANAGETMTFEIEQQISIAGKKALLPAIVTLTEKGETLLHVATRADLSNMQERLPKLMSRRLRNTCEQKISLKVRDVRAQGEDLRIRGQLTGTFKVCKPIALPATTQRANFDALVAGRLEGNCVTAKTREVDVRAEGLLGSLIGKIGLDELIDGAVQIALNQTLGDRENCFTLPPEFVALDTEIEGGRLIELGEGKLGAEVSGTFTTSAANVIRLIRALEKRGVLPK